VESAVASFLSPDGAYRREPAFARLLDRLSWQVQHLERNVAITAEIGNPNGVQGNVVSPGVNEFIIPNYKQTWAGIRKIAKAPEGVRHLTFKSQEYNLG
jgi:arsenite oxidase large subunit